MHVLQPSQTRAGGIPRPLGQCGATAMEDALLQEKSQVDARLKAVRGEIRAAKRARAEPLARPRTRNGLERCTFLLHAALVIWALRGDGDLAAQFVAQWRRRGDNDTPAWTKAAIVEKGEALEAAAKAELFAPTTARGQRALAAARKFLAEVQLQDWVRQQNADKGLAPSNTTLWERWGGSASPPENPAGPTHGASRPCRARSRRQWLQRWARRWRIRVGRFKIWRRGEPRNPAREGAPFCIPGRPNNGLPAQKRNPIPRPDSGRKTRTALIF